MGSPGLRENATRTRMGAIGEWLGVDVGYRAGIITGDDTVGVTLTLRCTTL